MGFGTRLWKAGMDQVYLPFYRSFMIKDQGAEGFHSAILTAHSFPDCHGHVTVPNSEVPVGCTCVESRKVEQLMNAWECLQGCMLRQWGASSSSGTLTASYPAMGTM